MLKEPTMQQLGELRLAAFASAWVEQQKDQKLTQLAFDERLALLVEAECTSRENKRAARALKDAKLRISQACSRRSGSISLHAPRNFGETFEPATRPT